MPRPAGRSSRRQPAGAIAGRRAGVLVGISGLDRLALSRYLREQNVEVTIVANAAELTRGLRDGKFDFAVTEALLAEAIAAKEGWTATWAPPPLARYPLVLGLWKGDLTLKRAIVASLEKLERNGEVAAIKARYLGSNRIADFGRRGSRLSVIARLDRAIQYHWTSVGHGLSHIGCAGVTGLPAQAGQSSSWVMRSIPPTQLSPAPRRRAQAHVQPTR